MRVADETPDRLTLEASPWLLGSFLILVILVLLAVALANLASEPWLGFGLTLAAALFGVAFVVFVRRVVVIFDRPAKAVVIRTASFLGQSEQTLRLADVQRAGISTHVSRSHRTGGGRSTSRTHAPVLVTPDGDVPLTQIHSGGDGAERVAKAINRWLGIPSA